MDEGKPNTNLSETLKTDEVIPFSHVEGKENLLSSNHQNNAGSGCQMIGGDSDQRLSGDD